MVIKVGINGFGRVGRIIFRSMTEYKCVEVTAINDPAADAQYISYLIKYDSTHGNFKENVSQSHDEIFVNGKPIKVFNQKHPSDIPWHEARVQYVIEASGMFTSLEKASGHLKNDVEKVIVTSPSADIPMLVLGVNDADFHTDAKVISSASSTLYCLALIAKVLEGCGGVEEGFLTCVHAMTASLKPLDGLCARGKHWRDHRGIHQNIIPTKTGVCKALGKVLPRLRDRLAGLVLRVPIVDVSVLDLTVRLAKPTSLGEIISKVEEASRTTMKNIIRVSNECAVSSDFIKDPHSCVLDAQCCQQLGENFFKLVCWYENEYSYACRVVDTIRFCEKKVLRTTLTFLSPRLLCDCIERNTSQGEVVKSVLENETELKLKVLKSASLACSSTKESLKARDEFQIWYEDRKKDCQSRKAHRSLSSEAQERLAKVKHEFTKMVHKTEDLLRKSQSNRINVNSFTNIPDGKDSNLNIKISERRYFKDSSDNKIVKPLYYSGDFELVNKYGNVKKTTNGNSDKGSKKFGDNLNAISRDNESKHSTKSEEEFLKYERECKTKVIDSNTEKTSTETLIGKSSNNKMIINNKTQLKYSYNLKTKQNASENKPAKSNNKQDKNKSYKAIQTIVAPHKKIKAAETPDDSFYSSTIDNENTENLSSYSDKNKGQRSTEANIVLHSKRKPQKDILEKLDSASDTDSELSLRLRERKSQVIELSELTTSHEDLHRLDKICRILEISDDLSDRLFSPLKNSSSNNKEWSFKDLCDKIRLDEFCDDVFGKSVW